MASYFKSKLARKRKKRNRKIVRGVGSKRVKRKERKTERAFLPEKARAQRENNFFGASALTIPAGIQSQAILSCIVYQ